MLVVFANQKGGCGKTTNCIQFANYLHFVKEKEVIIFDVDFQRSISDRREVDKVSLQQAREADMEAVDNEVPYDVVSIDSAEIGPILEEAKKLGPDVYALVDLPGRVDDDNMPSIFREADAICIPFNYDKLTLESTFMFVRALQILEINVPKIFIPNRVKTNVRYETIEDTNEIFATLGQVMPAIPDRVALERISTIEITNEATKLVEDCYDRIINVISI